MKLHAREIEKKLGGPNKNADFLARYIGGRMPGQRKQDEQSRLVYWGLKVPLHREASKSKFSFSHLSEDEQWRYWQGIWTTSKVFDVKSVAMHWIGEPKRKALRLANWRDVVAMADQTDNWAHSDGLSSLLAEILEQRPQLFSLYKKWNRSKNPWLRRQSIVGIYCYARMRKKHIPASQAIAMVKNLLKDPHFYVQRGVGWTLREIDRVDTKKQRVFVRKNILSISPTAWFATSELYPVPLRKQLVELRRK